MEFHHFHPSILREYDVRGVVGETLFPEDAYAVGRSFATMVIVRGGRQVCVGLDGRLSSPELEGWLVKGICDAGCNVLRVGRGPTPMLYFSVFHFEADAGIMITGSHNPSNYNGFKMSYGREAFYGGHIKELGSIAAQGSWKTGAGFCKKQSVKEDYVACLAASYLSQRDYRVAWDCGNGAAGEVIEELIDSISGEHFILNGVVDGNFPAHHPDPTVPENLIELQNIVVNEKLDCGFAFDGDADRIGIIDSRGRIIWGDQILVLLARDVLIDLPGSTIIADVKASQVLFDEISRAGGNPIMYRTGHSLIKDKMVETGAPLAGEMSGHIFFSDRYLGFDDALYVALRVLSASARSNMTLADFYDDLPKMKSTPEIRFECADECKFSVVEEIKARLTAQQVALNDIDGVRVDTNEGWWLLRASNTEPALVARCEGHDDASLGRLKKQLVDALDSSDIVFPRDFDF